MSKERNYTVQDLKKYIAAVEKKFGKKALKFEIEVHKSYTVDGEMYWAPYELDFLGVATYAADDENKEQTVLVIR